MLAELAKSSGPSSSEDATADEWSSWAGLVTPEVRSPSAAVWWPACCWPKGWPLLAEAAQCFLVVRGIRTANGETILLGDTLAFQGACFPSAGLLQTLCD